MKLTLSVSLVQDDEINLQCQLVEKLKQQMLDQDEVRAHIYTETRTKRFFPGLPPHLSNLLPLPIAAGLFQGRRGQGPG